ncbi:MAG: DegV family protein [Actinobacteria bacterium]|nr:DegV family protein [Actinomycetota bacterium]
MPRTGIVCDSTCDLGPEWCEQNDVAMVPLKVHFDEVTYLDWVDLAPDTFFDKLAAAETLPKTSQPSPAEFAKVYSQLAEAGCEEIVSIHLTAALSGTMESAMLASKMVTVPVHVINTLTVSIGTGLAVIAAVKSRDAGGDAAAIRGVVQHVVDTGRLYFALDTLDYLVKGGRAGKAQGLAASVLNIKPVLTFNRDGTIEPFKKVKGTKKAIAEIAAAVAASGPGRLHVGVLHSNAPELAAELLGQLEALGVDHDHVHTSLVGAVIGTYAGPRAVGAAVYPM